MDYESNSSIILEELKKITENEWIFPENSYDEVYPNLILGDQNVAKNIDLLRKLSVTHVLNAAQGGDSSRSVDTNEDYYKIHNFPCKFLGIPGVDVKTFQIHPYFNIPTAFIDDGLNISSRKGKVLVHCLEGISRSATFVIAYLMMRKGLPVIQATQWVRDKRIIIPNGGFLQQLCDLDRTLRNERKF